jgi:hypothetical protein
VLFCADADVDLEEIHRTLAKVADQVGAGALEVDEIEGPEALSTAGWTSVAVRRGEGPRTRGGEDLAAMEANLEAVVKACATALNEDVLGVFQDSAHGSARACLHSPGGFPRSCEGEVLHVLRQAASWLEADAVQLMRYFAPPQPKNELQAPVADLSDVQVSEENVEAELDDEDRFVEAKLKVAREWMDRYQSMRNKG